MKIEYEQGHTPKLRLAAQSRDEEITLRKIGVALSEDGIESTFYTQGRNDWNLVIYLKRLPSP